MFVVVCTFLYVVRWYAHGLIPVELAPVITVHAHAHAHAHVCRCHAHAHAHARAHALALFNNACFVILPRVS